MWKQLLIFAGGALLGSTCTYLIVKKKFSDQAQEEINEVRTIYFEKCRKRENIDKMNEEKDRIKEEMDKGYGIASSYYVNDEDDPIDEKEEKEQEWELEKNNPVEHPDYPYSITPHDFAYTDRHYDKITLLYYPSEEVLINEIEGVEEDVNATIGEEALSKFGEFEEDVVYIRNDRLGIDYEVILQPNTSHYLFEDTET